MSTLPERPQTSQDGTVPISKPPAWAAGSEEPIPEKFGEFELVSKLGAGSFGQVFLARQASLGRNVALKVMRGERGVGSEGQLLAGLEHDHIVKVYSAFADAPTGLHGLCLQYVPGADLGVIIRQVFEAGTVPQSGRALLDALDAVRQGEPGFDPAALRDREGLASDNYAQAVCRLGGRLAEALAFAHARGILHCDIKPGNILLTPYGRPMLADFNVAFDRTRHAPGAQLYGGTLAYMAPEYRAAVFAQPGGAADERCDIFSLGVVLYEMVIGARPQLVTLAQTAQAVRPDAGSGESVVREINLDQLAGAPRELVAVIRRCLELDPAHRYQTAGELATALAGAWSLLGARRSLPRPSRAGRWVSARPALALVLAGVLPHLVASVAQIGYNAVEVQLDPPQQRAFGVLVIVYNAIVYPVGLVIGVALIRPLARGLARFTELPGAEVDELRGRVRRFGWQVGLLGAIGWFPGGLIFPLVINLATGSLPWQVYAHFAVSFALAGVIGCVFSYLAIQYVVFRAALPRLGNPDTFTQAQMAAEVRPLTAAFGPSVVLACGVPLLGAVLLLALGEGELTFGFRLLVVMLIVLGAGGVLLAERVVRRLRELAAVWLTEGERAG